MSKSKRNLVQVVNPRLRFAKLISKAAAQEYCNAGVAYWLADGRLKFRHNNAFPSNPRQGSDVYVSGSFNIKRIQTKLSKITGAPRFPVIQFIHGDSNASR